MGNLLKYTFGFLLLVILLMLFGRNKVSHKKVAPIHKTPQSGSSTPTTPQNSPSVATPQPMTGSNPNGPGGSNPGESPGSPTQPPVLTANPMAPPMKTAPPLQPDAISPPAATAPILTHSP